MAEQINDLETAFIRAWPATDWPDVHVVLAVSGGPDSVAMLRAAVAAKERAGGSGKLFVAHLNHGLRPSEAAADEEWLQDLCRRLDVPLEIGRCNVPAIAAERGDGLEAAARTARYEYLRSTAERIGARFVAVAHTADDQVETVLHRVIRGSGVAGLTGMPRVRRLSATVSLIRPLLDARRQDVVSYLQSLDQDFRTDATNAERRFTRNRLRHELLPLLRAEFNADVDSALLRLSRQAVDSQELIASLAEDLLRATVVVGQELIEFDHCKLAAEPPLLVREVGKLAWTTAGWPLQNMGFDEWQQLANLIASNEGCRSLNLPSGVYATRRNRRLYLSRSP